MQNVTFTDTQNQPIVSATMDVPRQGELVAFQGQGYTVSSVRYYVYPNNTVHAVVQLTPLASASSLASHYQSLAPK